MIALTITPIRPTTSTPTTPAAHVRAVDDALAHMDLDHLLCRDLGHLWRSYTARYVPSGRHYEQTLRCERCACERTRIITADGYLARSRYSYPEGYLTPGAGRYTTDDRAMLRVASVQSMAGGRTDA